MTTIFIIYLTGVITSALCNIVYTFGEELPKEKWKYWMIIPEALAWFIIFPLGAIFVFVFHKKLKRNKEFMNRSNHFENNN